MDTNLPPAPQGRRRSRKLLIVLLVVAAAAAGVTVYAFRDKLASAPVVGGDRKSVV